METLAAWFRDTLLSYGAWGIAGLAALDASFLPMPQLIDVSVMVAAGLRPEMAIAYAVAAVVGSTLGAVWIYGLARAGRGARLDGPRTRRAEERLRRHGAWGVFVSTLLPPPFPFKVVVLTAGYLRQPLAPFVGAVAAGRTVRFGVEAALAALYGRHIIAAVRDHGAEVGLLLALLTLAIVAGFLLWRRRRPSGPTPD